MTRKPYTEVNIGSLSLKNPVLVSSGTYGFGEEYAKCVDIEKLGALVTKTITLNPRKGNPPQRIVETPSGILNAIGLQNPGFDMFVKNKLPFLKTLRMPIIVNIAGDSPREYAELTEKIAETGIASAFEINISCPNVKKGGIAFGVDPKATFDVVHRVRKVTELPIITKLSPNVTDIKVFAKVAIQAGTDAVSLINTLLGMSIDVNTMKPKIGNITGGLSGPAVRPVAVRMVWQLAQKYDIPIIGMGGIEDTESALEFY